MSNRTDRISSIIDPFEELNIVDDDDEEEESSRAQHSCVAKIGGIGLSVIASLVSSLASAVVKLLSSSLSIFELSAWRSFTLILPALSMLGVARVNPLSLGVLRASGWQLLFRGLIGSVGVLLKYYALQQMPVGDVSAIAFLKTIFVAVFSSLLLGEHMSMATGLCAVASVGGGILVARCECRCGCHIYTVFSPSRTLLARKVCISGSGRSPHPGAQQP